VVIVKPIVKWAGGKSRLLGDLLRHVPEQVGTYIEAFAGGAALFFALAERGGFKRAVLCDQNEELITCYRAVKKDVSAVIEALSRYKHDREVFYKVRDADTKVMSDVERAARLIYLNRTCFNGLYRVNASGKFNVPFGRYKNPRIVDVERLEKASRALKKAELLVGDFTVATKKARAGDFVYFDPPYVPLSRTAAFTEYAAGGFDQEDQERLVAELVRLKKAKVPAMLSNHDTPETRELYKQFRAHVVYVSRPINSDPKKRGAARELVVTTWEEPGIVKAG
jgi:DNA adenine methylase